MARRRNTHSAGSRGLAARLPWWAGVALAAALYAALHALALQPVERTGETMAWQPFVSVAQYLLPALCLLAAAGSVLARGKRRDRSVEVVAGESTGALGGMSRGEFDTLMGEAFRLQGFQLVETVGAGGRVDMVLRRERQTYLVQCKHWQSRRVDAAAVNELCDVMASRNAAGGFVVTSGRFSREASALASANKIRLIEGPALLALIKQAQGNRAQPR